MMYLKKFTIITYLLCFLLCIGAFSAWSQTQSLDYQSRYDKKTGELICKEGRKPQEYYGDNYIELISAIMGVPNEQFPEAIGLEFYLAQPADVYLTVQELEPIHFYKMDKTIPKIYSTPNAKNTFEWSSRTVLIHLEDLNMYDLGALARLDYPKPDSIENIAPIMFFPSDQPNLREGVYLFYFRPNRDVKNLSCSISHKPSSGDPEYSKNLPIKSRQWDKICFNVPWDSSGAPAGDYELRITGKLRHKDLSISQIVRFYHNTTPGF